MLEEALNEVGKGCRFIPDLDGQCAFSEYLEEIRVHITTQDAAIKALADALEAATQPHSPDCPRAVTGVPFCACETTSALRMAGRLP
jgi:hypothetical protein